MCKCYESFCTALYRLIDTGSKDITSMFKHSLREYKIAIQGTYTTTTTTTTTPGYQQLLLILFIDLLLLQTG